MSKIISVHSFHRGTGKSTIIANVATLLAIEGLRVGVIDTGFQSPSVHILFDLDETEIEHVLNDYIWGKCDIEQTAYDVTSKLNTKVKGRLFLVPSSTSTREIAFITRKGYDVGLLNTGLRKLVDALGLDLLMLDTHAGINEETLLSIALSDALGVILRVDKQDHQGTAVTIDLARKLSVSRIMLILNEIPPGFDLDGVRAEAERTYDCEVIAVLPHSEELLALASESIFVLRYPKHPNTVLLQEIARKLTS